MAINKSTALPPWASVKIEPKRKFKYVLTVGDIPAWVVKTSGRPEVTIGKAEHSFMAHNFKFPGRVTWNDIEVTLVDIINPDVAGVMFGMIEKAGYTVPSKWNSSNEGWKTSLSKTKFSNNNLGDIAIKVIDHDGKDVERWTLRNVWISKVAYDNVDYSSEDLLGISATLVYDYADLEIIEVVG